MLSHLINHTLAQPICHLRLQQQVTAGCAAAARIRERLKLDAGYPVKQPGSAGSGAPCPKASAASANLRTGFVKLRASK